MENLMKVVVGILILVGVAALVGAFRIVWDVAEKIIRG
jgi:hypothetical protein